MRIDQLAASLDLELLEIRMEIPNGSISLCYVAKLCCCILLQRVSTQSAPHNIIPYPWVGSSSGDLPAILDISQQMFSDVRYCSKHMLRRTSSKPEKDAQK